MKTQVHLFTHTESSGIFWEHSTMKGLSESFCTSDLKTSTNRWRGRKKYPRMYGKGHDHKKGGSCIQGKHRKLPSVAPMKEPRVPAEHPTSVTPEAASDLIF